MEKNLLDPEVLRGQSGGLTEDQKEAIKESAYAEIEKVHKGKVEEEDEEDLEDEEQDEDSDSEEEEDEDDESDDSDEESDDEDDSEDDSESDDEEEKKPTIEDKLKAAREKEEKDLTDEEKALIKQDDEVQAKAREEEKEAYIDEYAEKFGLTRSRAEKDVEKIYGVYDRYKGNPKEMSQALYHLNSKLSQVNNQMKQMQTTTNEKRVTVKGKLLSEDETKEFLVNTYKNHYKDQIKGLDEMSDEVIADLAWKEVTELDKKRAEENSQNIVKAAEEKRKKIVEDIPDRDKRFIKDIRGAINRAEDVDVLQEDFDVQDYIYWARGKNYHKDIEEAVKKATEEATKDKKIIGLRNDGTHKGSGKASKKGGSIDLKENEKIDALEMFKGLDIPDKTKFKRYKEYLKDTNQKK